MKSSPPACPGRRGFALALVVFFLLAISMTATAGYLVVSNAFVMADQATDGAEALAVARAGLHRFVAEQIGVVGDSVSYAIGDGTALITTRKLLEKDSLTDVYLIRSAAQIGTTAPVRRVVRGYAIHHRRPLAHHASAIVSSNQFESYLGANVTGLDQSSSSDCPGGGTLGVTGAIARTLVYTSGGVLAGLPVFELWASGHPQIYDSVGLRWDILTDPSFPVDFDGVPPSGIPSDSFPVVRYTGNLFADNPWDGRGVLIVTGQFDSGPGHDWEGIVLAGWLDDIMQGDVDGMVIGGLAQASPYTKIQWRGRARYNACHVYSANESLSFLELLEHTVHESS